MMSTESAGYKAKRRSCSTRSMDRPSALSCWSMHPDFCPSKGPRPSDSLPYPFLRGLSRVSRSSRSPYARDVLREEGHDLVERRQEAKSPVKVSVLRPCTGPLAPTGRDMVDGARLSLDEVHMEMGGQSPCQYRFDLRRTISNSKWPGDSPEAQGGWCWPALPQP